MEQYQEGISSVGRWDEMLSEEAKQLVENRRRRYVGRYAELADQGYRVVAELSPRSGRLLWVGRRVALIRELEANDIIRELEERDKAQGINQTYEVLVGCVVPTTSDGSVRRGKDIHAYKFGISVAARSKTQEELATDRAFADLFQSSYAQVEPVVPLPTRRESPHVPLVYA